MRHHRLTATLALIGRPSRPASASVVTFHPRHAVGLPPLVLVISMELRRPDGRSHPVLDRATRSSIAETATGVPQPARRVWSVDSPPRPASSKTLTLTLTLTLIRSARSPRHPGHLEPLPAPRCPLNRKRGDARWRSQRRPGRDNGTAAGAIAAAPRWRFPSFGDLPRYVQVASRIDGYGG